MNDLVFIQDNERALTTSLLIAEAFGKKHQHVLRDIETLECSEDFRGSNFGRSSYTSRQNKELPMYLVTKDGFVLLAMSYTGERAAMLKEGYIGQFNQMEALLLSDAYILKRADQIKDRMILALKGEVEQHKATIDIQKQELQLVAPKVEYYEEVLSSTNDITTTTIAKEFGRGASWLNNLLHAEGIIYKHDGNWLLYSRYAQAGYSKTRTYTYVNSHGEVCSSMRTTWTQAGREMIHRIVRRSQSKQQERVA